MKNINKIFKNSLIFLLLCFPFYLQAQILSGTVLDDITNKPIEGVFVYLEGTSINSITNSEGKFQLSVGKRINTSLMFYTLSYFPVQISNPYQENIDKIYMKQKVHGIKEVTVENFYFTREQKMKVFREQFLGTTKEGESCSILNEDDIELYYDLSSKTFTASAEKPIIIFNKHLAYEIRCVLYNFIIKYSRKKTLDIYQAEKLSFRGSFSFTDLYTSKTVPVKIKKARKEVYKYSSPYFFKSLVTNQLEEAKYEVFSKILPTSPPKQINPYNYFAIQDTLSCKLLTIIPGTDIHKDFHEGKQVSVVGVEYDQNKDTRSEISFLTDSLLVDSYGKTNMPEELYFSGFMSKNRVGNFLPFDYQP